MRQHTPSFSACWPESTSTVENLGEALQLLDEALARVDRLEERWFEAELQRLKGEALLVSGPSTPPRPKACYRQALDVARDQSARLWELRAATSLARLWRDQGKRAEARDLLAPVYDWFTEGFDTADLKGGWVLPTRRGRRPALSLPGPAHPEHPPQGGPPRQRPGNRRIRGDRVADADLGELRDHVAERRQVVEVEVVPGIDAEPRLLRRLGGLDVAPEQERRLAGREGFGIGPGIEPRSGRRRWSRRSRWCQGPDP